MCDALVWSFDALTSINWLEVITALAGLGTAIIAFSALRNWKRQDKAKREAEFLDELIEAAHTYIAEMAKPITLLQMTKIGMESYAPTWEDGNKENTAIKGAIAYIEKNGKDDAKRLLHALEAVQPSTIQLRSLAAKGQVFKFNGYEKCQNAVVELTRNFDQTEALTAVIGSPTLNWEHSEVLKALKRVMTIDPNAIRKSLETNNVTLIQFARDAYERAYG